MNRRGVLHFLGLASARSAGPAVANGRAKLVLMPSRVHPRRIIINGHPTSNPARASVLGLASRDCGRVRIDSEGVH